MIDFKKNTDLNLVKWLQDNKVLFVTNTKCRPGSMYLASLRKYINNIPMQNLWIINGEQDDGKPFYGFQAFMKMVRMCLAYKHYDYIIYIDEDCFINDFRSLITEFSKFMESGCIISGIQDGGIISHRNHCHLLVNTFLSFWNMKALYDKGIKFENLVQRMQYIAHEVKNDDRTPFKKFVTSSKETETLIKEVMLPKAKEMVEKVREYRFSHFPNGETPYAEVVKNDPNNPIEPHQIPYSYDDFDEDGNVNNIGNFEPYYILEEALIMTTQMPVYYFFATDFYDVEDENVDNSGLTTCVMNSDSGDRICLHTWFSRAYTKYPSSELQLNHTKRINSVIRYVNKG